MPAEEPGGARVLLRVGEITALETDPAECIPRPGQRFHFRQMMVGQRLEIECRGIGRDLCLGLSSKFLGAIEIDAAFGQLP